MPQQNIYFDEVEDKIIEEYQHKHDVSKADAVKQIVRKYKEGRKSEQEVSAR